MDFIKKLRAKSLKRRTLPMILILLAPAILMLCLSEFWLLFQKPANLYDVPRRELSGKYVTVEVPYIYACYAYTEEYQNDQATGNITSCEYIIDANENDYCGLRLPKSLVAQGDALLQESEDYLNYETDEITGTFTVRGIMKAMPSDSLDFYYETIGFENMTAEQQDLFLPLYLDAWDGIPERTTVCLIFGLAMLIAALVILCVGLPGSGQKQLLKKAQELAPGNPEYVLAHAEQLYDMAPSMGGLRMNASLILIEQGRKQYLYSTKDLVWAYQNVVRQRVYGIAAGTSHNLVLKMADGTTRNLPMGESQVREQLQKIGALAPDCALGYSQELEAMYQQRDRESLRSVAAAQRAAREAQARAQASEGTEETSQTPEVPAAPAAPAETSRTAEAAEAGATEE